MSDIKHISPANKDKLVKVVNKTASLVNEGADPTEALTKVAAFENLSAEYILRAAEAYNGAAHLAYFKSAGLEDRGNSFLLADGAEVIKRVLESEKVSDAKAELPSFAFTKESKDYFNESIDDSVLVTEKQAAAPDLYTLQKKAYAIAQRENLDVLNYQARYNEACEDLAKAVSSFRDKTASVSAHRKGHWAREMLERHGNSVAPIVSLATGVDLKKCIKSAAQKIGYFSLGVKELDSLDSLVRAYHQTSNLHSKLAQVEHDAYVNKQERDTLLNSISGFKTKSGGISLSNFSLRQNLKELFPEADPAAAESRAINALMDPFYTAAISKVDKALLARKLLNQDEIVSKRSPAELQQALSEVYSLAPTASQVEPLLRSMLRKRLESGDQIDEYSLNQMLTMEDAIRRQRKDLVVSPRLDKTNPA